MVWPDYHERMHHTIAICMCHFIFLIVWSYRTENFILQLQAIVFTTQWTILSTLPHHLNYIRGHSSSIWVNICLIYMTTIKHNSKNKPLDSYTTRITKSKGRVHCSTTCSTEYAPLPFIPILCNTGTNICPCKFSFLNQHVHFTRRVIKRAYSSWNLLILHTATEQLIRVLWRIVYTLTKQSLTLIQINLEFKWRFKTQPLTLFCVFICCFRIRCLASQSTIVNVLQNVI